MPVARTWIVLALAVALVAAVVLTASGTLVLALMTCDGDGGSPYSADASPAGRFCRSDAAGPYFVAQVVLPILAVLVLGVVAVVRRRWRDLVVGIVLAATVLVMMSGALVALPNSCSDEQAATDPRGCATY